MSGHSVVRALYGPGTRQTVAGDLGTVGGDIRIDRATGAAIFLQNGIERCRIELLGAGADGGGLRLITRLPGGALAEVARLTQNGILQVIAGQRFQISDATNADSGTWQHDGTDLTLTLVGTTDYNIQGANLRIVNRVGFNNTAPIARPAVAGSRGANVALANLLIALDNYGLITDNTVI